MICLAILLSMCSPLALAQQPGATQKSVSPDPVAVARSFLPPNTQLAQLYRIEYSPHWTVERRPAVVAGHVLRSDSDDIVCAYYSPQIHTMAKTLFLDLLTRTPSGYEKVYEVSYRSEVLLIPNAIRILRLKGVETDAISIVVGMGAALGGHLHVLVWRDPWGWQDIFPRNSTGYTYFFPQESGLLITLSTAKHPGLNVSPAPVWFRWNGESFVKVPAPQGSSKWPLPD